MLRITIKETEISESTTLPHELFVSLCAVWSKGHFVRLHVIRVPQRNHQYSNKYEEGSPRRHSIFLVKLIDKEAPTNLGTVKITVSSNHTYPYRVSWQYIVGQHHGQEEKMYLSSEIIHSPLKI